MQLCRGCDRIARASTSIAPLKKRSRFSARSRSGRSGCRFCAARGARTRSPISASGSEVILRSWLPGEEEEAYEIDGFIANYRLSLVGVYSLRRRLEFRLERRTTCSRLHVRVAYPAYHGRLGTMLDRWQRGRRVASALDDSLVHFKGLVEFKRDDAVLADF